MKKLSAKSYQLKAKRSLGQHFLIDVIVIERILEVAHIEKSDSVLEIGPGTGALTGRLAESAGKVMAIELDRRMVEHLQKIFEASKQVSILEANILDIDLNELLEHSDFVTSQYKIVANLPYYITAPIIRTLLSLKLQPKQLTMMVQKEVAERMTAHPGAMSLLSLMAQYYAEARIEFVVPKEAFNPEPAVESAVVTLLPKRIYNAEEDRKLFRLARVGFAARRKTLANNLSSSLRLERGKIEALLETLGLRRDIRAQALSIENWEALRDRLD